MNFDLNISPNKKYIKATSSLHKKETDFFGNILLFILLLCLLLGGYLYMKKTNLEKENTRYNTSIENSIATIKKLTNSDNPAKKILIGKILANAKNKRVKWSNVINEILKLKMSRLMDFSYDIESKKVKAVVITNDYKSFRLLVNNLEKNEEISKLIINSINLDEKAGSSVEIDLSFNFNI